MEPVQILEGPFRPWSLLDAFEAELAGNTGRIGATATFVGTMRDLNLGDTVRDMILEHYPEMSVRELARIRSQAMTSWPLEALLVVHRVGRITPGEPIMLVAAYSAHRSEAIDACRHVVEELKKRAPFWKKETLADGERWVSPST